MRVKTMILASVLLGTPALAIPVPGTDFAPMALPGTTASQDRSLAGSVIYDRLVPFQPSAGMPGTRGKVQVRVMRTAGGTLDFYWCVTNDPASPDAIKQASIIGFSPIGYDAGWRLDGSGDVAPSQITGGGSSGRWTLTFLFGTDTGGQHIMPGQTSKCFFIRTGNHNFGPDPNVSIRLKSASGGYNVLIQAPRL